jgi:hypothetical protein
MRAAVVIQDMPRALTPGRVSQPPEGVAMREDLAPGNGFPDSRNRGAADDFG